MLDLIGYHDVEKKLKIIGEAVLESIAEGFLHDRSEIFITSKLHSNYHNPELIVDVIKYQISQLGLGYIDLYLIHCPWGHIPASLEIQDKFGTQNLYENDQPVLRDFDHAEIWEKLENAVQLDLVKFIGVSNFDKDQVDYILENCKIKTCYELLLAVCDNFQN